METKVELYFTKLVTTIVNIFCELCTQQLHSNDKFISLRFVLHRNEFSTSPSLTAYRTIQIFISIITCTGVGDFTDSCLSWSHTHRERPNSENVLAWETTKSGWKLNNSFLLSKFNVQGDEWPHN